MRSRWLMPAALGLMAPVAVFAANGMTVVLALWALGLPTLRGWLRYVQGLARSRVGFALGAGLVWLFLGVFWAPAPAESAEKLGRVLILMIAGSAAAAAAYAVSHKTLRPLAVALGLSIVTIIALYAIEIGTDAALIRLFKGIEANDFAAIEDPAQRQWYRDIVAFNVIGRGAAVLAVLVWPVALAVYGLTGRLFPSVALVGLSFVTSLYLPMASAPLAIAVGAVAFTAVRMWPAKGLQALGAIAAFLVFLVPGAAFMVDRPETVGIEKAALPVSWQHRIEIWHFSAAKIARHPVLGHGFDSTRKISEGAPGFTAKWQGGDFEMPHASLLPLHPHNGAIQVWIEAGAVGALLLAMTIAGFVSAIAAMSNAPPARATAAAGVAAYITIGSLSFGIWQTWWLATAWIAVSLTVVASRLYRVDTSDIA